MIAIVQLHKNTKTATEHLQLLNTL